MNKIVKFVPLILMAAALTACGGDSDDKAGDSVGTLAVKMTSSTNCGFDAVNWSINKIRVNKNANATEADGGWFDIPVSPVQKINLLDLNSTLKDLGQSTNVPIGNYNQARIVLDTGALVNSVVVTGGVETALQVPASLQAGIKVETDVDVNNGQVSNLVLDVDACQSVAPQVDGSFVLNPVVKSSVMANVGSVLGTIDPSLLTSNVVVTAQVDGKIIRTSRPNPINGAFRLYPLNQTQNDGTSVNPTNYNIVITADGHATSVITGVPVTLNQDTILSGSALTLPISDTRKVSGTVTPVTSSGIVMASQTLNGVPVLITYKSLDLSTGTYSFNLPIGAPLWGSYVANSVFNPVAQTQIAGLYDIKLSPSEGDDKTSSLNLGLSGDVTLDFQLP